MKAKLKMHHILIIIFTFFISGMIFTTLIKSYLLEYQRIKSEVSKEQLSDMVDEDAIAYLQTLNSEVNPQNIISADFYFFKNKRELEIILNDNEKEHLLRLSFKNLSPGFGLRTKPYELTPPEGIYSVEYPGFIKSSGYFVIVKYPPESYKEYQRLEFEKLKLDPFIISERAISNSFIQADKDFMKLFIYLITKLDSDKLRLLIYPDRPPLTMELGGTGFTSEVYKKLDFEYKKLNYLIESLKPKF